MESPLIFNPATIFPSTTSNKFNSQVLHQPHVSSSPRMGHTRREAVDP